MKPYKVIEIISTADHSLASLYVEDNLIQLPFLQSSFH